MVKLDSYLTTMNVHLPTLQQDLVLLAKVSKTYAIAAPDLVRLLRNATTTAHTRDRRRSRSCEAFFDDVTGPGQDLDAGADRPTRPTSSAPLRSRRPLLGLLDTYSPEFPCLLKGAARYAGRLNEIFRNGQGPAEHVARRHPAPSLRPARPARSYGEQGAGPKCWGLPYPPAAAVAAGQLHATAPSWTRPPGGTPNEHQPQHQDHASPRSSSGIFVMVSVIVTGTLTAIMGSFAFGSETEYKADFTSASLITEGRRRPGRRRHRRLGQGRRDQGPRRRPRSPSRSRRTCRSPTATRASIRFLNLVGDRYMALERGRGREPSGSPTAAPSRRRGPRRR